MICEHVNMSKTDPLSQAFMIWSNLEPHAVRGFALLLREEYAAPFVWNLKSPVRSTKFENGKYFGG